MFITDLGASWDTLIVVVITTVGIYLALIAFSRLAGLRSFAQMTNFDLAATVAFGSLIATTSVGDTPLAAGVVGLAVLFTIHWLLAQTRRYRRPERLLDNAPILLMSRGKHLPQQLAAAQMNRNDLRSKLRLAGVSRFDQVFAAILEVTGEVSVIRVAPDDELSEPELFAGVRGRDILFPNHQFSD